MWYPLLSVRCNKHSGANLWAMYKSSSELIPHASLKVAWSAQRIKCFPPCSPMHTHPYTYAHTHTHTHTEEATRKRNKDEQCEDYLSIQFQFSSYCLKLKVVEISHSYTMQIANFPILALLNLTLAFIIVGWLVLWHECISKQDDSVPTRPVSASGSWEQEACFSTAEDQGNGWIIKHSVPSGSLDCNSL